MLEEIKNEVAIELLECLLNQNILTRKCIVEKYITKGSWYMNFKIDKSGNIELINSYIN